MIYLYGWIVMAAIYFGIRFLISYRGNPDVLTKEFEPISWARAFVTLALLSGWFLRPELGKPKSFVILGIFVALAMASFVVYFSRNARARQAAVQDNPPPQPREPPEPGPKEDDGQH